MGQSAADSVHVLYALARADRMVRDCRSPDELREWEEAHWLALDGLSSLVTRAQAFDYISIVSQRTTPENRAGMGDLIELMCQRLR